MNIGMMTHFQIVLRALAQEEPPTLTFWWMLAFIGVVVMILMGWIYAFAFRHARGRNPKLPKDPD